MLVWAKDNANLRSSFESRCNASGCTTQIAISFSEDWRFR